MAFLAAFPTQAKRTDDGSKLLQQFVEARLAEVGGQSEAALSIYQDSLKQEPDNILVAGKTYVRAIESGNWPLALKAVRSIELGGSLEKEMPALLFGEAFRTRNWRSAETALEELVELGNFAFLEPILRNWIYVAKGSNSDISFETLEKDRTASYYFNEQRILLLLASGENTGALRALRDVIEQNNVRMSPIRMIAARHFLANDQEDIAKGILVAQGTAGERRLLEMIESGRGQQAQQRVTGKIGAAFSFHRLSTDLSTQRAEFLALVMAQIASSIVGKNDFDQLVLGRAYSASNNGEKARNIYKKIGMTSPYYIIARNAEIRSFISDDRFSDALQRIEMQISDQPKLPELHILKGQVFQSKGDLKSAAKAFEYAVFLAEKANYSEPTLASYYLTLGSAQEQSGLWPAGLRSLERANELLPNSANILNYLGYAQLERRENTAAAMLAIRQAHKLRSSSAAITDSLGWAYFIIGEHDKAVSYLEKALAGQPQDPTINEHLGDAYWTVGRKFEARYAWKTAKLFAEEADSKRLLTKIDLGLAPELVSP
ncbi:MAG: tetratricopeptide repeat protein [Parasphingorhabdus sp.]